ncbi:phage baseplate assembly protein V [Novosphingobium sp.]|uniref:phage baseplate assembly protein V n=1 Tax=Novosphingobium sp. TaxID=1874826 RepID=UPI00286CEDA8|nr:phage baseplate assembly protein V [Novosphingobium sp.]
MTFHSAASRFAQADYWRMGVHIGVVRSVDDPQGQARVQVQIPAIDPDRLGMVWARVAVAFAGDNFGAFLIPDVGSEVLVAFTAGDTGWPVVIGNLWNGATGVPESLPGDAVDRWTLTGKAGTRIAILEESGGQEKVEITTPNSAKVTISEESGGKITLDAAGHTVTLSTSGVSIQTSAKVEVNASKVSVTASQVSVDAGMSKFSGVVQCDTLITNSVVSTSYTPGAGNIW